MVAGGGFLLVLAALRGPAEPPADLPPDPTRGALAPSAGPSSIDCPQAPPRVDRGERGAAFQFGLDVGAHCPGELALLVQRGDQVPSTLYPQFLNGLAHGYRFPSPTLDQDLAEVQALPVGALPERDRAPLLVGVVLRNVMELEGQPDAVRQALDGVALPPTVLFDGLRIGYQQARGDDLPSALRDAALLPPAWWDALYEELGWRAARAPDPSTGAVMALAATVPPQARCAFLHGAVRGAWTWPEAVAVPAALIVATAEREPACHRAALRGLAWPLWEEGYDAARGIELVATALPPADQATLGAMLDQLGQGLPGAPWELPADAL